MQERLEELPFEARVERLLLLEKKLLEGVSVPVVTMSGTFQEAIIQEEGLPSFNRQEITVSRAHHSQAAAIVIEAWSQKLSTYLVDPINFVAQGDWAKVTLTQWAGKMTARNPWLQRLKEMTETHYRRAMPLGPTLEEPLKTLCRNVQNPIIAVHYEVGNILARMGKTVLQVVSDPHHVHEQYLKFAGEENVHFAVFDDRTKELVLEKAGKQEISLDAERVFVTGAPVDPRILRSRSWKKRSNQNTEAGERKKRTLRLIIATGGLGTNKAEIKRILSRNLADRVRRGDIALLLYAGTNKDFETTYRQFAQSYQIRMGEIGDEHAPLRIICGENIVTANDQLIEHGFPWADGVVTKPSADMTYDAAACGCCLLFLSPWGPWEERIRDIFIECGIAKPAEVRDFTGQIDRLERDTKEGESWIESAISASFALRPSFYSGASEILKAHEAIRNKSL